MTLPKRASELLTRLEQSGIRLGLESTRQVLSALGDPQESLPCVLVAGSNGKGSTAALLTAMVGAAGYRTGLYTSPHLEGVEERIRLDGRAVAGETLADELTRVVKAGEGALGHLPTYFEALTAAALSLFAAREVELAVLEVGLGGRLDATNASEPSLSLITRIGLDHQRHLGDTLTLIAREKAGILRAGRPALAWGGPAEAEAALLEVASEVGAELRLVPPLVRVRRVEGEMRQRQSVLLDTPTTRYELETGLLGDHQLANLSLAVMAAESLAEMGWSGLDGESICAGALACRWPGRIERMTLPNGKVVILDVAHNPDGIRVLTRYLDRNVGGFDLLFGAMADKELPAMLPPIAERASRVVLTRSASARAGDPETLAELLGERAARVEPRTDEALTVALEGERETLVICGSVYLAGEARELLRHRYGVPEAAVEMDVTGLSYERSS